MKQFKKKLENANTADLQIIIKLSEYNELVNEVIRLNEKVELMMNDRLFQVLNPEERSHFLINMYEALTGKTVDKDREYLGVYEEVNKRRIDSDTSSPLETLVFKLKIR